MTSTDGPIVMKFGGAALRDGERIARAARIVAERRAERPIVVVSALQGTTDLLDDAASAAARGAVDTRAIRLRQRGVLAQLELDPELLNRLLTELGYVLEAIRARGELAPRERDNVLSFGERMSARIFAQALRARGLDAAPLDAFDLGLRSDSNHGRARPLADSLRQVARALAALEGIAVVTGFVAIDEHGNLTTLGRNGSDLTAALLGEAARAKEVQFWKTVDGVMTADPLVVPTARTVERMSYRDAASLGFLGARVLFAEALEPLERAALAARVACVDRTSEPGTRIDAGVPSQGAIALAVRHGVARATFALGPIEQRASRKAAVVGALANAGLDLLALHESDDALTLVAGDRAELAELARRLEPSRVEHGFATVAAVGATVAEFTRATQCLEHARIDVSLARHDERAALFLVNEPQAEHAARRIHGELFEPSDATAPRVEGW